MFFSGWIVVWSNMYAFSVAGLWYMYVFLVAGLWYFVSVGVSRCNGSDCDVSLWC